MRAACVSTWHGIGQKYFDAFIKTALMHGIEPQNADPNHWAGTSWQDKEWFRKSEAQANFVKSNASAYDVFMFVDSYDVIFATGWTEILDKFKRIDSPIVFGAECYPWPYVEKAEQFPKTTRRCRYLNAGFWMGLTEAVVPFIEDLEKIASNRAQCDQGIVVDMFLSGKYPIKLDNDCAILHCCNMDSLNFLKCEEARMVNIETNEKPCLFHGNANSNLMDILKCMGL